MILNDAKFRRAHPDFVQTPMREAIAETLAKPATTGSSQMSYKEIWDYYLPLALTPFIGLSIHPHMLDLRSAVSVEKLRPLFCPK